MKHRGIAMLASLVVMALIFAYMAGMFTSEPSSKIVLKEPQADSAQYREVKAISMPQSRQFSGTIRAHQSADLSARINAKVADVLVDTGDTVQAGDILLRLESDDLSARVIQQQQALASSQAQVNDARINFNRVQKLVERGLLPVAERDTARARLETADADLAGRKASLSEAEVTRDFSVITAPFDGVISRREVNQGDTATVGANLISIYNPNSLRLEAAISESVLPRLNDIEVFSVSLDTQAEALSARALEVEPAADAASRSFTVKFGLESQAGIYPGMFGRVAIPLAPLPTLAVPKDAVITRGQLRYVHVKQSTRDDETPKNDMRIVRLGETFEVNGQPWVAISAGLDDGEWVRVP
ncbi:efflux RND transporter periplasmic adaptor subunit [Enterovibrio sp. 27052020O]|uniref:efflux RND transporter periplasmic adaptor subunit n=1 Tax=Enterovibrio sp. 27052020O TaxID=3241166 RepID=UPI00388CFB3F